MAVDDEVRFKHSSFCGGGSCVEVAAVAGDAFAVRNSAHPHQPSLLFTAQEWADFVRGVKAGEFDPRQASATA